MLLLTIVGLAALAFILPAGPVLITWHTIGVIALGLIVAALLGGGK